MWASRKAEVGLEQSGPQASSRAVPLLSNKGKSLNKLCCTQNTEYYWPLNTTFRKNIWLYKKMFLMLNTTYGTIQVLKYVIDRGIKTVYSEGNTSQCQQWLGESDRLMGAF